MALVDDLKAEVATVFSTAWERSSGRVVPVPSSIGLGNKAIEFESATVLYADLDGSTAMVDRWPWMFCAEIYKTYLHCAAKLIKAQDGVISAYDGDRVMAVFIGERKCTRAATAALQLNYAVRHILNPALKRQYPQAEFELQHAVGIDMSSIRAARTGVRGDNDLVWIGRAANYAAKLTSLPNREFQVWITADVFNIMAPNVKQYKQSAVWQARSWSKMNDLLIYGSNWVFAL